MKKNSQNQQDYTPFDKDGKYKKGYAETNSGEVMTIENEAYTIRELLDKFTTGVFNPGNFNNNQEELEYTDDMMDSEVPEFIDRTDVEEYVSKTQKKQKMAENALNEAAKKQSVSGQKDEHSEDNKPDKQI